MNLADHLFDDVFHGHEAENAAEFIDNHGHAGAAGAELEKQFAGGLGLRNDEHFAQDAAQIKIGKRGVFFEAAFAMCDVIAMPTSPTPAFRFGERTQDPLQMYLSDIFTVPANLAGLPAISIPTSTVHGLPLGVQLYAPPLEEPRLLQAAAWLEGLLGFERRALEAA